VSLICVGGAIAVGLTAQATAKAEDIHLQDRQSMQATLGNLGKQYVLFSLKEGLDYANTGTWELRPSSAADQARLHAFVDHAVLLNYGVAIVDLGEHVLTSYTQGNGALPPVDDPGFKPMIKALLAQQPDVSSVMRVGSVHVVAMGVPITVDGNVRAVFVGFVRLDTSALETYVKGLHYGRSGLAYVIDSRGTVVAASNAALIGTKLPTSQARAQVVAGHTGTYVDSRDARVVSYSPFGLGGWGGVTTQKSAEFFGPINAGKVRIELAIVAVLVLASVAITIFGFKRERARRRFQEQLAYQAAHDGLTGLVNRSVFHERLNEALIRGRTTGRDLAVLFIDLDLFKPVNDVFGHGAGDTLLVEVSARLRTVVRLADTVARMGGDEFAVLMEDLTDTSAAEMVADRVLNELIRPLQLGGHEVTIGASIGIAFSERCADQAEELVRDADLAMYQAKNSGGNCVAFAPDLEGSGDSVLQPH
jgi:diguanylate cyclase (GGDEF)-like protein